METSSLVMLILPCCVTHFNSFLIVIIHSAFLLWSTGLSHNSLQNLIDSSATSITCFCLIFPFNCSYKAFWLFLKVRFCRYCFTADFSRFSFNVLADMRCLRSSVTVLKALAFILYSFFSSHFNLVLPFFQRLFYSPLPKWFLFVYGVICFDTNLFTN